MTGFFKSPRYPAFLNAQWAFNMSFKNLRDIKYPQKRKEEKKNLFNKQTSL